MKAQAMYDNSADTSNFNSVFLSIALSVASYVASHVNDVVYYLVSAITIGYTLERWIDYRKNKKLKK